MIFADDSKNLTIDTYGGYKSLDNFSEWYRSIHGYASLIICILGITLNFFNIIVLTRKHMISSTNAILTALAISDFLTMLVYIPTSLKYYCVLDTINADKTKCSEVDTIHHTFFWTAYALFYINLTVTMHSISLWLTVLLALFRYLYICHNKIGQKVCTMKNTLISIIFTYLFCIILNIPSYTISKIVAINQTNINRLHNETTAYTEAPQLYELAQSDLDRELNGLIFRITFISQSFIIKLLPCIVIIILSSLLIRSIHVANETNKRLQSLGRKTKESEKSREFNNTNIMLVLVCVLFFVTEFPQGILAILSIIFESTDFHKNVYMKLGDIMDILALINNAVNFILYCLMSRIFRRTFKDIFCKFLCLRKSHSSMALLKFENTTQQRKSIVSVINFNKLFKNKNSRNRSDSNGLNLLGASSMRKYSSYNKISQNLQPNVVEFDSKDNDDIEASEKIVQFSTSNHNNNNV